MVFRTQHEVLSSSFTKIHFDGGLKVPALTTSTKSVRFSQRDSVFEIPHINDLSDEEIEAVWMKDEDFKAIRRERHKTIMAMEEECMDVLVGVELRGLESHMPSQRSQSDAIQEILYSTVEKIQCFQDETNMDISDLLAEMCQKISLRSEKMARQMALDDEVESKGLSN